MIDRELEIFRFETIMIYIKSDACQGYLSALR